MTEGQCADLLLDVAPLVMAAIRCLSNQVRPPELSIAQFRALAFITRHQGQSLSAVADLVGLSLSSVSKLIEGLVESGYVHHEICPQDRRRARLEATAKGQAVMKEARASLNRELGARLAGLAPDMIATIIDGLVQLQQVFAPPSAS